MRWRWEYLQNRDNRKIWAHRVRLFFRILTVCASQDDLWNRIELHRMDMMDWDEWSGDVPEWRVDQRTDRSSSGEVLLRILYRLLSMNTVHIRSAILSCRFENLDPVLSKRTTVSPMVSVEERMLTYFVLRRLLRTVRTFDQVSKDQIFIW